MIQLRAKRSFYKDGGFVCFPRHRMTVKTWQKFAMEVKLSSQSQDKSEALMVQQVLHLHPSSSFYSVADLFNVTLLS